MKQSAGILLYKIEQQKLKVLLVHPGGPFWTKKDSGSWTIPKGEPMEGEDLLLAAKREFQEETGQEALGIFRELASLKQKGGKLVHAWAVEGSFTIEDFKSNTFEMEWPPGSGKMKAFPEVDKAQWFIAEEALVKSLEGQRGFIIELQGLLSSKL